MAQKIESDKLLVKDVFSKWFRIPEYQRPYVWDKDQVVELLDDVMQAIRSSPDSQYFLGSLVLKKNLKEDGGTKYEEYDLLDGQQRLTTLFLITAVIRDLTDDKELKQTCEQAIFQKENKYSGTPERLRIVFDIRDQVKEFIKEFIKENGGTTKEEELKVKISNAEEDISIRNMSKAIINIREYFSTNNIEDFFLYLRLNVLMIYVSADELDDAFRLFTVMNSRGVKLRNSDILKAENLGVIFKDDTKRLDCAKKWEDTESYFAEDFDEFLSYLRTILVKQKAAVSLLKEFEDNIYNPTSYERTSKEKTKLAPLLNKGEDTFKFVDKYKRHYEQLFDNENYDLTKSFELYNYLHLMKKGFEADIWKAPLLRFYDKFKTSELISFVKALDNKFANDWLVGYTPTIRIEKVNSIIQAIDDANTAQDVLKSSTLLIDKKELKNVLEDHIYGKRAARYVLLKLDLLYHGHTTKLEMPENISIEHILPQNPTEKSIWKKEFKDLERENWTNKLGNLVLISRRKNSAQGNKDYADKKNNYFRNNVELFSNSIRIYNQYSTWTLDDLTKNHNEVLVKIKQGFDI